MTSIYRKNFLEMVLNVKWFQFWTFATDNSCSATVAFFMQKMCKIKAMHNWQKRCDRVCVAETQQIRNSCYKMVEEKIETIAFSKTCVSYLYETLNAQKLILNLGQNTLVGISIKYRFFAEVLYKKPKKWKFFNDWGY